MKTVCAWCNREMDDGAETGRSEDHIVSHGICNDCADNVEFQMGVSIKKFLNSFDMPVIMVDHDGRAITANSNALELVNKDLAVIKHAMLGNIFECAYARLPRGCGRDTHCSGCTIRNAVKETFETGVPHVNLPATVAYDRDGKGSGRSLLVSTENALNYVLLRIEPVAES